MNTYNYISGLNHSLIKKDREMSKKTQTTEEKNSRTPSTKVLLESLASVIVRGKKAEIFTNEEIKQLTDIKNRAVQDYIKNSFNV